MRPCSRRISKILLAVLVLVAPASVAFAYTEISAAQAKQMMDSGMDLIVLDVREYYEFCDSYQHIEDAVMLPWSSGVLITRYTEVPSDATIIVLCLTGSRSPYAAAFLESRGYSDVYDMTDGMYEWPYETEGCDPAPVLTLHKDGSDVEINWTPMVGSQDYDLLRGLLSNITDGGLTIDLGPVDCLAETSPYTYLVDPAEPLVGDAYFYLSRQIGGSWGQSSQGQERIPQYCN
jgi:rhodanese-related sulfurtransferase